MEGVREEQTWHLDRSNRRKEFGGRGGEGGGEKIGRSNFV